MLSGFTIKLAYMHILESRYYSHFQFHLIKYIEQTHEILFEFYVGCVSDVEKIGAGNRNTLVFLCKAV